MSDFNFNNRRELECLRLASELTQLAADTSSPQLKAHCVRMAEVWSGEAEKRPAEFGMAQEPDAPTAPLIVDTPSGNAPVVLVVEDDPLLRMLAIEVVEEAGCLAIEAEDADEAVALLESRSDIALLFTDIDMPGSMDGLKLAHAVRGRWPPIKILVVSGHVRHQHSVLPSNSCFVKKPYRMAAMVEELRALLGIEPNPHPPAIQ